MKLGVVLTLVLVSATTAWARTAVTQPTVTITSMSPAVVRGVGFVPRERVTVTVSAKGSRTRAVTAGATGAFRIRFAGFSIPRCTVYGVRAKGNRGSFVSWKVVTMCAEPSPAGRTTTEPAPLYPTDPTPKKP
ncbi:MAG: hypothetical protein ACYDA3_06160 [Gaiellaceae bacterium]